VPDEAGANSDTYEFILMRGVVRWQMILSRQTGELLELGYLDLEGNSEFGNAVQIKYKCEKKKYMF